MSVPVTQNFGMYCVDADFAIINIQSPVCELEQCFERELWLLKDNSDRIKRSLVVRACLELNSAEAHLYMIINSAISLFDEHYAIGENRSRVLYMRERKTQRRPKFNSTARVRSFSRLSYLPPFYCV